MFEDIIFVHELSSKDIELLNANERKVERLAKKATIKKVAKKTVVGKATKAIKVW